MEKDEEEVARSEGDQEEQEQKEREGEKEEEEEEGKKRVEAQRKTTGRWERRRDTDGIRPTIPRKRGLICLQVSVLLDRATFGIRRSRGYSKRIRKGD